MTEQQKEATMLILEFMDEYNVHELDGKYQCSNCGHEYSGMLSDDEVPMIHSECDPDIVLLATYHTSWDSLMPVIEKLQYKYRLELHWFQRQDYLRLGLYNAEGDEISIRQKFGNRLDTHFQAVHHVLKVLKEKEVTAVK